MKQKPTHPSDAWDAQIIANATIWTAYQFLGCQNKTVVEFPSRAEATAKAQEMADANHKPALVYGITPEGRQTVSALIHPST